MAIRRQSFEVTTDLPTSLGTYFNGTTRETVSRAGSSSRPARLLGYRYVSDALTGRGGGFTVREVPLIDSGKDGDGLVNDEVPGRVVLNVTGAEVSANDDEHDAEAFTPLGEQPHDAAGMTATAANSHGALYFNTRKLEVELYGGGAATDTATVELLYETAGDYRF
jgi:hypothetical protein